jgi:hypothetical protein
MGWYDRKLRRVRDLSCGDTRIYLELEVAPTFLCGGGLDANGNARIDRDR